MQPPIKPGMNDFDQSLVAGHPNQPLSLQGEGQGWGPRRSFSFVRRTGFRCDEGKS